MQDKILRFLKSQLSLYKSYSLKNKIIKSLRINGWYVLNVNSKVVDLYIIKNGVNACVKFIEKKPGIFNTLTQYEIETHGGIYVMVHSLNDIKTLQEYA